MQSICHCDIYPISNSSFFGERYESRRYGWLELGGRQKSGIKVNTWYFVPGTQQRQHQQQSDVPGAYYEPLIISHRARSRWLAGWLAGCSASHPLRWSFYVHNYSKYIKYVCTLNCGQYGQLPTVSNEGYGSSRRHQKGGKRHDE